MKDKDKDETDKIFINLMIYCYSKNIFQGKRSKELILQTEDT